MTKVTLTMNEEFNFPIIDWEYNMLEITVDVEFGDYYKFIDKEGFVNKFNHAHYSSKLANALAFAYIIGGADAFCTTLKRHIESYYNEFDEFVITADLEDADNFDPDIYDELNAELAFDD